MAGPNVAEIRVEADASQAVTELRRVNTGLDRMAVSSANTEQAVSRLKDRIAHMAHLGVALAVSSATIVGISRMADEWNVVTGQMKLASEGMEDVGAAQEEVYVQAQRSGVTMAALGDVYVSVARNAENLQLSQQRVLAITGGVSSAIRVMGGATQGVTAALGQFAQMVNTGQVRTEEMKSVVEQFPALAQAIAQGMDRSVGELLRLVEAGQVTIEDVLGAIERMGPTLDAQAETMPLTFSAGMEKIRNATAKAVAELDKGVQTSASFASAVDLISEHVDDLIALSLLALGGALGQAGLRTAQYVAETLKSVAAHRAAALASEAAALAQTRHNLAIGLGTSAVAKHGAATAAMASRTRLAASALALVGGSVGAVATTLGVATAAWVLFGDKAESSAMRAARAAREARDAINVTTVEGAKSAIRQLEISNEQLQHELSRAKDAAAGPGRKYLPFASLVDTDRIRALEGELARNNAAIREHRATLDELGTGASSVFRAYVDDSDRLTQSQKRQQDLAQAAREHAAALTHLAARYGEGTAEYRRYADQVDAAYAVEQRAIEQKYKVKAAADAGGGAIKSLIERSEDYLRTITAEEQLGRQLTAGEKLAAEMREQLADGTVKLTARQREKLETLIEEIALTEEVAAARKRTAALAEAEAADAIEAVEAENRAIFARSDALVAWEKRQTESAVATAKSMDEQNVALEEQVARIGLTDDALRALEIARLDDVLAMQEQQYAQLKLESGNDEYLRGLLGQIDALKKRRGLLVDSGLREAQAAEAQAEAEAWKSIEQTAHSTFVSIFEGGKNTFERLTDTLKNTLYDLLYQMTIKKWVISVAAAISPAAATQAFGAQAVQGAAGSAAGGFASSLASSSLGVAGQYAMTGFMNTVSGTGLSASLTAAAEIGGMNGAGMALGAVAVPLAAIAGIAALLNGKAWAGDPDAFLVQGAAGNSNPYKQSTTTAFGTIGFADGTATVAANGEGVLPNGTRTTYGETEDISREAMSAVLTAFDGLDATLAATLTEGQVAAVAAKMEGWYEKSWSASGKKIEQWIGSRYEAMFEAMDGPLADWAAQLEITAETVADVVQSFATLNDYLTTDLMADAMGQIEAAGRTTWAAWSSARVEAANLAAEFDGSLASAQALATATQAMYQSELQVVGQIQGLLKSTHAMFATSAEEIRTSVMSDAALYDYLREKSDAAYAGIMAASDPEVVAELAQQGRDAVMRAWGILDETQRPQHAEEFASYLEAFDAQAAASLGDIQDSVLAAHDNLAIVIGTAIETAMTRVAERQEEAAAAMQAAAETPVTVRGSVRIELDGFGSAEVGLA